MHVPRSGASFYNVQCICSEILLLVIAKITYYQSANLCSAFRYAFFLIYNAFVLLKYPCLLFDYLFFHSATPIFLGATPNLKNRCGAKKNRCGARKFFARSARGATPIQNPVHASGIMIYKGHSTPKVKLCISLKTSYHSNMFHVS